MNGLEFQKGTVQRWRGEKGDVSTYLLCQKFDGFYTQAQFQGNWDVMAYASAATAANAARANGRIYTTDLNDPRIEAGEKVYYTWNPYGHVCTIIGRDSGGLLVTNTANAGDDLGQLGNHVKISHAHTLGLPIIGISSRDGNNPHITGVSMYLPSGAPATSSPPTANSGDDRIKLENWAWYTSASDAVATRNPHGKRWTGEPYLKGDYDVLGIESNGAIRIKANDGSTVWVHPSARQNIYYVAGGTPRPSTQNVVYFDVPASGQYYYNKYENALNGNYDPNQIMYGGSRVVVENPGTGPVRIKANDGSLVWVGTRRNPAKVR